VQEFIEDVLELTQDLAISATERLHLSRISIVSFVNGS
jgi:hypothetical protein